jgi:phenylpyruvate tautomerase PptA (4-oxalocrotonate tautomerase family)
MHNLILRIGVVLMPYIKVQTNQNVEQAEEILKELSSEVAERLGKPESYIMTSLKDETIMTFAGSTEKTAFIEVKSIGLKDSATEELSEFICEFLEEELGIKQDRIYIEFSDVPRSMWGWKGGTF